MQSRSRLLVSSHLALVVLVLGAIAAPGSAHADGAAAEPGAPVTQADHVTVAADGWIQVDVLANDSDPDDPSGQDLDLCLLPTDGPVAVFTGTAYDGAGTEHPVLELFARGANPGTYTLDYDVCDYQYLTPATLTITVTAAESPYAERLAQQPGHVRFHNPGAHKVAIRYGGLRATRADGALTLAPHTSRTVPVTRRTIVWTATLRTAHGGSTSQYVLRGIKPAAHPAHAPTRAVQTDGSRPARRDATTGPPTTAADDATVPQDFFTLVDVLANDSDPDTGSADDLAICRATVPAGSGLEASPVAADGYVVINGRRVRRATSTGDQRPDLLVQAGPRTRTGTYRVTYYACDDQYLSAGTVRVKVTRSEDVSARKVAGSPGVVRFTNPGTHQARVTVDRESTYEPGPRTWYGSVYSSPAHQKPLARFVLPPHSTKDIHVHVRGIEWDAFSRRGPGGYGFVRGLDG